MNPVFYEIVIRERIQNYTYEAEIARKTRQPRHFVLSQVKAFFKKSFAFKSLPALRGASTNIGYPSSEGRITL